MIQLRGTSFWIAYIDQKIVCIYRDAMFLSPTPNPPVATTTTSMQLKEAQLPLQTGAGINDILNVSHVTAGKIWNEID